MIIYGGNNEADSSSASSVGCNPYDFFYRSTASFRLSDALKSNYLNWDQSCWLPIRPSFHNWFGFWITDFILSIGEASSPQFY